MNASVSMKKIMIAIIVLACVRIDSISYLTSFGLIYRELPILFCVVLLLELLVSRKRVSPVEKALLMFYGVFLIATFLNNGSIHAAIRTISPSLTMSLLCESYMREDPLDFMGFIGRVLTFLVIADFITVILLPNGLYKTEFYENNWLLGYKSARVNISLPAIALISTESIGRNNKISFWIWLIAIISIIAAIKSDATGGSLVLLVLVSMMFFCFIIPNKSIQTFLLKIMNVKIILVVIIVLNISVAIMQNISIFEPIIVGLLDKDMSLTGRTYIWKVCIDLFSERPILGNGFLDSITFVKLTDITGGTQPHNFIMALLVYTGIMGLLFVGYALISSLGKIRTYYPNETNPIAFWVISIMVMGITSMNTLTAFTLCSFVILWWCGDMVDLYNMEEREEMLF